MHPAHKSKTRLFSLAYLLIGLTIAGGLLAAVTPVRASPGWVVSLDANSTSQTDVAVSASASQSQGFRVGAVINATSASPLNNVFGWEFNINYNASAFIPEGDPSAASLYPDGAAGTVLFGAQTFSTTPNWAGLVSAGKAFGSSSGFPGQITVFFTILSPNPAVNIQAKTLLANVNFELLAGHQASPQSFTISNVVFVDASGSAISDVIAGPGATETVNNEPPHALFTATAAPVVGPFAFTFNATASFDPDGTIPNPAGYFWDFGDGTQDLGLSGAVVTHNYGVAGRFNATLRVQDNLGATGSARDSLGNPLFNGQPSHMFLSVTTGTPADQPPVAMFSFSPSSPVVGSPVLFDGSASFDPDGQVLTWLWNFGDGSRLVLNRLPTVSHAYTGPGTFQVTLTVTDNANLTGMRSATVIVQTSPSLVGVDMNPSTPGTIDQFGVFTGNFSANVDVASVTSLFAWQFALHYNNTILSTSVARVSFGGFWQAAISSQQAFIVVKVNQTLGVVLVAFTLVGSASSFTGSGVLASIGFTPLHTGTGVLSLSNVTLVDSSQKTIPVATQDGSFTIDQPPVAVINFSPSTVLVGQPVFFDGTRSFDPDGVVSSYIWSFGDGTFRFEPIVSHVYGSPGNFTVTLTAIDNVGLQDMATVTVQVRSNPVHDVGIGFLSVGPTLTVSGGTVNIGVGLNNFGSSSENVTLAVYYDSHVIITIALFSLPPAPPCPGCFSQTFVPVVWNTTGVPPGSYTISATVFLPTDQNLSNNSLIDGVVTILPPPTLTLTPTTGVVGTKVVVHGSGFPAIPGPTVLVSFDDMFLGFASTGQGTSTFNITGGTFDFTFSVPLSQPGIHLVKALDEITLTQVTTVFLVLPSPSNLALSIDTAAVYFPGDTATIYVLATVNGVRTGLSGLQLQLILVRPNGSNVTLQAASVVPGLFKATFTFPKTGSVGTYLVLGTVRLSGSSDATAIKSFEVKPSWLTTGGPTIGAVAAVTGILGVAGVAWRKGYFRKRGEASSLSPF